MNINTKIRWGCIVFAGILILLCGGAWMWQSLSCHIPPADSNVEVVVSACRDPYLYSISPDGKYLAYGSEGKSWLRNLITDEEQSLSIGGELWLSDRWLLQETNTANTRQFWIFDVSDESQTPLQWVQEISGTTRRNDGVLVFSSDVITWFRQANTVFYAPESHLNIAVALSQDFKNHPEANYVLATPRSHQSGDEQAILTFLTENAISYVEVKSRYRYYPPDPLPSHNGRFIATGTRITTLEGKPVVQTEELYGTIHGWAYDDSGVYYQLPRLSDGSILMPLFRVGKAQPILKLKIPEAYLDAPITASP